MTTFIKALLFCLVLPFLLYPQYENIKFERISVEHGLSNGLVKSVLQDHQGFMWFATEEGLNKYDGYKFTIYRNDPNDSTSLGSNNIKSVYEDPSGNLWISTIDGGLNRYNREKDNFFKYMPDANNPESISNDDMQRTIGFNYDGEAVLWIGTSFGLNKMDIAEQKFKYYPHTKKAYPHGYVEVMAVDSIGYVWIGCTEGGLYKFNPWTETFTNYQHDPGNPNSISDNGISALWFDNSGSLWVGTRKGGLNKFDSKNERFIHFLHDPNNPHSLSEKYVSGIYEDRAGNFWVGTAFSGLNKLNRGTGQFSNYKHDPGNPNSLGDNWVMSIYEDKSDVLWVGTVDGVYKSDPGKNQFANYSDIPGNRNSLNGNYIGSIQVSNYGEQKTLWIGTKTGGINKLDRNTGRFTHYVHDPGNPKSIPHNCGTALYEDRTGILWIGSWGNGLISFDPETEKFNQYIVDVDDPISQSSNIIRTIYEDKNDVLWIGTQSAGLIKFNRETNQFSHKGLRTQVLKIYEDSMGELWIGASWRLFKLNRKTQEYTSYKNNPDDPNSISSSSIHSIHEDKTGRLWFGTYSGGLNKFNRESGEFKSYTMHNGLPNDVVQGILEDKQGNLWLSTNNGLSKFNPETEIFRNYDVHDGLAGNQFFAGAYAVSKDGEMYFGSSKGLVAFYPERLKDNSHIPKVVITDFQIFNESVILKKNNDGKKNNVYALPKPITLLEEIEISYKENIFSFEFAALDYRSPQKNQYAYKMEGVDPNWVNTDASRRFATYTNLDPGEYTFTVKGSNNDGHWNDEGISIKVIITPPWWKTNIAYILYFAFCISIIVTIWRFQTNRLRMKQQMQMQNFEAEKLREVDKLKSRFFANISHEFRTPLTLIKGPVKQMLGGEFTKGIKDQFRMILRNSDRLLELINQILDLSKLESGEMKLKVIKTDISQYLKGMVLSFSSLAESKKVTLNFSSIENSVIGYIDRDKLEKIVTNLLSNAFKFTPEGGEIVVGICQKHPPLSPFHKGERINSPLSSVEDLPTGGGCNNLDKGGCIQISISNTGPGIPSDQNNKIFNRFYQADDNYNKDSEGSGIGLALTKELVEACHGEITVSSIPNKKTTFGVSLPISKESFEEDEIVKSTTAQISSFTKERLSGVEEDYSESEKPDQKTSTKKSAPLLLIVEDTPDVTSYICSFMENEYRIISAENGRIGLKKSLDKNPDLVISDVMMPEMDGFELCQKIKADERISHIPVILLTAKADLDSKIDGLEFGADDYINKPFEANELKVRTKNLINQRQKLREKFSQLIELKPEDISASSMDEQLLRRLLSVFEKHMEEPGFGVEKLAREIGISRVHLNRKLQALTKLSTADFIRTLRLQRAARLLSNASGTVSEIAYKVGFSNLSHFSKAFRRHLVNCRVIFPEIKIKCNHQFYLFRYFNPSLKPTYSFF